MFIILIVIMWVYKCLKTYKNVRFIYVHFIECKLYLNKTIKKEMNMYPRKQR